MPDPAAMDDTAKGGGQPTSKLVTSSFAALALLFFNVLS